MINRKTICVAALMLTSAGCASESDEQSFTHLTPVDAQHFAVHRHNGPDAVISASGDLTIAGKAISLSGPQKELAVRYFAGASAVRDDGLATGMAGAATAVTALSSVVSGLANGEPDKIGPEIDAKAAKIEQHVEKLCRDLHDLATTQDALAASLPDFKPYALIMEKDVNSCQHG